jgi:hypothetical protein
MIRDKQFLEVLGEALLEMFEREYRYRGDLFATEEEWARIQAEPLEYSDLVKGMDAGELLRQILTEKFNQEEAERERAIEPPLKREQQLAAAIAEFPAEFGLRAFPGRVFRISKSASYVNDAGQPVLYAALKADAHWQDFAKVTPAELRSQVVPLEGK